MYIFLIICPYCVGGGKSTKTEVFEFQINEDMRPGEQISYPGFGNKIKNGPPGNLIVSIDIIPTEEFEYEGNDLLTVVEVNPFDVFLGKKIDVDVFGNVYNFTLPPYFDFHQKYVLRGKGLKGKFETGNLIVKLKLNTPTEKLGDKEIEKIKNLRKKLTNE